MDFIDWITAAGVVAVVIAALRFPLMPPAEDEQDKA